MAQILSKEPMMVRHEFVSLYAERESWTLDVINVTQAAFCAHGQEMIARIGPLSAKDLGNDELIFGMIDEAFESFDCDEHGQAIIATKPDLTIVPDLQ